LQLFESVDALGHRIRVVGRVDDALQPLALADDMLLRPSLLIDCGVSLGLGARWLSHVLTFYQGLIGVPKRRRTVCRDMSIDAMLGERAPLLSVDQDLSGPDVAIDFEVAWWAFLVCR
jgi:hypothetical protein